MRRWVIALIAVLGLSSLANAQTFSIGAGVSGSGDGYTGVHVMFTVGDLVRFDLTGLDARLGLSADFHEFRFCSFGCTAPSLIPFPSLEAAVLGTFSLADLTTYAGPAVQYVIFYPSMFKVGAVLGVRYQFASHVSMYLEGNVWPWAFHDVPFADPPLVGRLLIGISYIF
jgi:hypothetical protein